MKRWDCIKKRMPKNKAITGAEIGVYKGKMSAQLLKAMPRLKLYMVDRWSEYSQEEISGDKGAKLTKYDQSVFDTAYQKARKVCNKFKKRAQIIRADSVKAAELIKDFSLDFAFIDGGHSYDAVMADIKAWYPKIKEGGYLCGHDYTRQGVKTAVKEMFGNRVETDDDKTWFVRVK